MIWIGHTTRYRKGSAELGRAARTLAEEKRAEGHVVRLEGVETKADFTAAMGRLVAEGAALDELHLVAHSGMYGPMFGTTDWPEQLSPHEWRELEIPFATGGEAYFESCRSGRWFAAFFARTFGVPTWGYQLYTCFSARPDRFVADRSGGTGPLYVVSAPGRKSHGLLGSVLKHGLGRTEPMQRFEPGEAVDRSYDRVAELYDAAFTDITVRRDEWRWLDPRVPKGARVLDLGCGNGALLAQLAPRLHSGVGVDGSEGQLDRARLRCREHRHLRFEGVDGPRLPFKDASFDLAISLLSWRYLDWDPLLDELERVLTPRGRLLMVDMVASPPVGLKEWPRVGVDLVRSRLVQAGPRGNRAALRELVADPGWAHMLQHNPMRAEHEYRWYFESRFPGRRLEVLNRGWRARTVAFDTGPFSEAKLAPMAFP